MAARGAIGALPAATAVFLGYVAQLHELEGRHIHRGDRPRILVPAFHARPRAAFEKKKPKIVM
jgi:hypothetical protein